MSEAHPSWTRWILIPANEKDKMLERINGRLSAEGIAAVEMIILKWRMSQLLRDIQRKYSTCSFFLCILSTLAHQHMYMHVEGANFIGHLAEGSMLVGIGSSTSPTPSPHQAQPENGMLQSPNLQRSEHSPSETRPYDPIRDV